MEKNEKKSKKKNWDGSDEARVQVSQIQQRRNSDEEKKRERETEWEDHGRAGYRERGFKMPGDCVR